jgi:hypothetical protein
MTISELYQLARTMTDVPSQLADLQPDMRESFIKNYVPRLTDFDPKELTLFFQWWKAQADPCKEKNFLGWQISVPMVDGGTEITALGQRWSGDFYPLTALDFPEVGFRLLVHAIELDENRWYLSTPPSYAEQMDAALQYVSDCLALCDPKTTRVALTEVILGESYSDRFFAWVEETFSEFTDYHITATAVPPEHPIDYVRATNLNIEIFDWFEYTNFEYSAEWVGEEEEIAGRVGVNLHRTRSSGSTEEDIFLSALDLGDMDEIF